MSILKEFKTFAVKGNVVDMAVGIIIGAAFGKIVSSFVGDVFTPALGLLIGGVDFSDLVITLKAAKATSLQLLSLMDNLFKPLSTSSLLLSQFLWVSKVSTA